MWCAATIETMSFFRWRLPMRSLPERRGGGDRGMRRRAGALDAGIHVGLVVEAHVQHVVAAFQHAGQRLETDIEGAAVTAHGQHLVVLPRCFQCRLHARGHGGRVLEQGMHPAARARPTPARRGEHLEAAGGVGVSSRPVRRPRSPAVRPALRRNPGRHGGRIRGRRSAVVHDAVRDGSWGWSSLHADAPVFSWPPAACPAPDQ